MGGDKYFWKSWKEKYVREIIIINYDITSNYRATSYSNSKLVLLLVLLEFKP